MSIDTLRKIDGTYRRASYKNIKKMLIGYHTDHLKTELGTVAFRPFTGQRENYRGKMEATKCVTIDRDTRAPGETTEGESKDFVLRDEMNEAIRYAFEYLNGSLDTWWTPGDDIDVWANQGRREGCILATVGDEAILEYEMPGTISTWKVGNRIMGNCTSALRIITTIGFDQVGGYKSVSYKAVPKKWIAAIRESGQTEWIGMGQRSLERIPFPAEVSA